MSGGIWKKGLRCTESVETGIHRCRSGQPVRLGWYHHGKNGGRRRMTDRLFY